MCGCASDSSARACPADRGGGIRGPVRVCHSMWNCGSPGIAKSTCSTPPGWRSPPARACRAICPQSLGGTQQRPMPSLKLASATAQRGGTQGRARVQSPPPPQPSCGKGQLETWLWALTQTHNSTTAAPPQLSSAGCSARRSVAANADACAWPSEPSEGCSARTMPVMCRVASVTLSSAMNSLPDPLSLPKK